jgi:cytochrome c peroxidase
MKAKKITFCSVICLFFLCLYFVSCKKTAFNTPPVDPQGDPVLPLVPYDYASKHNVNSSFATLGRVLFYDKKLSVNDGVACASCHQQEFAFANNTRFDRGFDGKFLGRNSPSIQGFRGFSNVASDITPTTDNQKKVLLFWDGRQSNLSDMVLNPVINHKEMNMPGFAELVEKLNSTPYYRQLFLNAYGDETITKERIALALEAFVCCLNTKTVSAANPIVNTIPTLAEVQTLEDMGKFLFHTKYNCAECHDQQKISNSLPPSSGTPVTEPQPYSTPPAPEPGKPSNAMFNIGLDEVSIDKGLGNLTGISGDVGLFKVPTLQNIAFTAPYMHDGRFATLDEVLEHYSHNIKPNANLSPKFKDFDGNAKKLNILPAEKNAIIAFLKTLKDDDFLTSPMYSDPFKK